MVEKRDILYTCPICKESYNNEADARACLAKPANDGGWKVGDAVIVPGAWHGWYCRAEWLACSVPALTKQQSYDHFDWIAQHHAWYVITAITRDTDVCPRPHDLVMHLATYAYSEHGEPARVGYTPCVRDTHLRAYRALADVDRPIWRMPKVSNPISPAVQAEMADLVKQGLTGYLL